MFSVLNCPASGLVKTAVDTMLTQILDFLHRVVLSNLLRLWFSTLLGKGKCVPLIPRSNKIIRHSAVNLAKQIRRREVS